jgi:AcrR family transcriptional regulator
LSGYDDGVADGLKATPRASRAVRTKPPGSYHHGDLRRALLDAARVLVEREGRQALTLRATARMAGVSQAAPYRHFQDKDALLAAVAEEGLRALAAFLEDAAAKHPDDPRARLQALGVAYVRFASTRTSHFQGMFAIETPELDAYPSLSEAYEAVAAPLLEAIIACQRGGLVANGDPRELALVAWSIVHGLAVLAVGGQVPRLLGETREPGKLAQSVTLQLMNGLAPR